MDKGLSVHVAQAAPFPLDAAFDVAPGEVMALVGPSGSGKTTVLRSIAGFHTPQEGRIVCNGVTWFDGTARVSLAPRERPAGFVFQSYALFPHMTALQNVMEALGDRTRGEREEAARALLGRVHLDTHGERRPAELSGGEQQRVAVARALARRPDVLLMDEPFSAVDRMTRRRLRQELEELRRELPMPVVLVTHDLDDVRRLADRLCVMHRGRILQSGKTTDVLAHPADATVAELLDIE
jgi:molybdate transport system ATP-binding protein